MSLALQDGEMDAEDAAEPSESVRGSASDGDGREIGENGNESNGSSPNDTYIFFNIPPPTASVTVEEDDDSDHDSLTAPTMQLGEHTSDEETSEVLKG